MIALWKTNYSIGKSVLTLEAVDPKKNKYPLGAESIFKILTDEGINDLTILDDTPHGFFEAYKRCKELKISLQYGISFWARNSVEADDNSAHKVAIFMLNDQGYKDLIAIYSIFDKHKYLDYKILKSMWTSNLLMAVPFYDSFLHKNLLENKNCVPSFDFCKPIFFTEDNGLPFDPLIKGAALNFAKDYEVFPAKSIYYKNRVDIKAYLTYKLICNRSFGKEKTLSSPNFNHFSSDEFCWESYKEQNK